MAGGIVIAVVLLVFPVLFLMSMAAVAALLGQVAYRQAEARHEGSELVALNR